MNIGEIYTTAVYEVLNENIHKYSSTSVSGGGGTDGHAAPITSTTRYHSDQDIWVKNIETGEERKFQFKTFNIDVRLGHRILCAWNDKSKTMERVINLNTRDIYAGGGIYNDSVGNGKKLKDIKGRFIASLRLSWWLAIPYLSSLHALFAFFKYFIFGKGVFWGEKSYKIRAYGFILLLLDVILLLWALSFFTPYYNSDVEGQLVQLVAYMIVAVITFTFIHMKIIKAEFKVIKNHSDSLDQYLNEYIKTNKAKFFTAE